MSLSFRMRVYYNMVFGALGGLISWLFVGSLLNISAPTVWHLLIKDALIGTGVGFCIGSIVGAVDGIFTRSLRRLTLGAILGGFIGGFGGMIGLLFGELVFSVAHGGGWARALGWAILGFWIGLSDGLIQLSPRKMSYGVLGGILGGLIGGSTYERLTSILLPLLRDREVAITIGSGLGLVILGACIGSLIAAVEVVLKQAWVKVLTGRFEGRDFSITKKKTILGKADRCDIVLPGDEQIALQHAAIIWKEGQFILTPLTDFPVQVNRQPIRSEHFIKNGDIIRLGNTNLRFYVGK